MLWTSQQFSQIIQTPETESEHNNPMMLLFPFLQISLTVHHFTVQAQHQQ